MSKQKKKCVVCGVEFELMAPRQIYCSKKCKQTTMTEYQRQRREEKRGKPNLCLVCGKKVIGKGRTKYCEEHSKLRQRKEKPPQTETQQQAAPTPKRHVRYMARVPSIQQMYELLDQGVGVMFQTQTSTEVIAQLDAVSVWNSRHRHEGKTAMARSKNGVMVVMVQSREERMKDLEKVQG